MADDDPPFYAPNRRPSAPRQPTPGFVLWTLQNGPHTLRCELRDDERQSAGVDVVLIQDDELLLSKRCLTMDTARYIATVFRQDHERQGWAAHSGD